jgi:hypothetical protein
MRPHVGAAVAASLAGKAWLQIGQACRLQPIEQHVNAREPPVGVWQFSNSEAAGGSVPIDRDGVFVCQIDGADRDHNPERNG